jgi:Tol biopolymer transport system component/DNA-binding winged helix-turn-helix (wHTH) protein
MRSVVADEKRPPLRFGGFTLNPEHHALFCDQERLHITEKPLETLIFLVENRGRVVEKQKLLDAVWTGTFVTEDTLVHAVREIRRILKDDKDNPRFIQTVPRHGYRFIGEVFVESNRAEINEALPPFAPLDSATDFPEKPSLPGKSEAGFRTTFGVGLAGLLIIALTLVFIVYYKKSRDFKARYETQKQLTAGEFSAGKPSFSPDGKLMLCVWSSPETKGYGNIFVISVADGRSIPITAKENPSGDLPVFTADSNYVVYSRYRSGSTGDRLPDLRIVPSSGLTEPRIYIAEASGAGFSPDGKYVAYTKHLSSQKALWLSPTSDLDGHFEIAPEGFTPRFSPDGKWLAYTTSNPEGGAGDLWTVDTATFTKHRNLTEELQELYGLTWTADSRSIIFSSKRSGIHLLWQLSLDDTKIKSLMPTFGGYAIAPSVSPDGRTLIFQYGRVAKDLLLSKIGSEQTENLTNDELHEWVKFSPSGKQIASVVQRQDFGKDVSIIEIGDESVGQKNKRFALPDINIESVCWLDEKRLAYLTHDAKTNQTRVVVINTGNGMPVPLTSFEGKAEWLAVHPEEKIIAVVMTDLNKRQKIILRNLDAKADETIAEGGEYAALRWVPDGSALSWSGPNRSADAENSGVWIWSKEKNVPARVANDGFSPVWSKDKDTIYYSKTGQMTGLWQKNQKEEQVRTWTDNVVYFDVAGGQIVFIQAKELIKAQIYSVELEK